MITEHLNSPLLQIDHTYPMPIQSEPYNYSPFRSLLQMAGHIFAPFMQEGVRFCLLEPDEKCGVIIITCLFASPDMKRLDGRIPITDFTLLEQCKFGKVICIEDCDKNQGSSLCGLPGSSDIISELLCPVIAGERILCILSVQRNIVYHWTKEDILNTQKIAISLYRHIRTYEHLAFRSHLLDTVNDAIVVLDSHSCIYFWNKAAENLFGYSSYEVSGLNLDAVLNIDQSFSDTVKRSLTDNNFYEGEIVCSHKSGQIVYVDVLGIVCQDEEGEILEVVFSLRDNTERRNMKRTLKKQANDIAQQAHLLGLFNEAITIWKSDGCITYWNKGAEQLFGYQQKEALGQIMYDLLQPRILNTDECALDVLTLNEFETDEIEYTRKDGVKFIAKTKQKIIINEDGEKLVFGVTRNVTDYKHSELLVRHQYAILKHINKIHCCSSVHTTMDELSRVFHEVIGEVTASPLSFVAEINEAGALHNIISGISKNSGPNFEAYWPFMQTSTIQELFKPAIELRKTLFVNTIETVFENIRIPDGHPIIRRFLCVPYVLNGKTAGIVAVANKKTDYTDDEKYLLEELAPTIIHALQKKREQIALQKNEQRTLDLVNGLRTENQSQNELLNALSHELRNPLATIVASLHLLEVAQDAVQVEKAKVIMKRQTEQLCRLTDELLDHTRIQNDKIQLRRTRVELKCLLLSIIEDYSLLFRQKGLQLITDMQPNSLYLFADPVRLEQLIGNILDNAIKYTESGGTVNLTLSKSSTEALIQITDNGRGIKPEVLPRLFDPFVQENRYPEMRNNGLGLGLSIAMGIAKLHGGSIDARSEGAGKGSTFFIHLPLPASSGDISVGFHPQNVTERPIRILFIEDNIDFARMLCAMMQYEGHKAESAKDGPEGLVKSRTFLPDVIVCDVELLGSNCFEFARHIRSDLLLQNVYLIAIAGPQSEYLITEHTGFDTIVRKPVDMSSIKKLIENIPAKP